MEDKKINRAFNEMYIVAQKRLESRSPIDIAKKAGVVFCEDTSTLKIKSLDKTIELIYPSYEPKEKLEDWYVLILLHYLDIADGTPISSEAVHFGELQDGLIRGVRFDKTVEGELGRFLFNKEPEQVINVCKSLGAEIIESKFDLCAVFYLFPNYLVTLNIWFADEEFEASGKMLVDKSADHYLTMEDSVMVGEFMLRCISERYKQLYDAF
ncbi:MAG: DUF3786 domain-containing protein [Terrisporobacter othiniensis]|uniref:DUF3786 domain-containing protein n=1 Tax=Terrisporobacter othiniensis TaxID=1577792 RepID=UPI0029129755|nr:DUF3786 domain-containing protein [Terrisporobacter othiniensis]MDU6983962.1 DUF3786 domain-containing protein [Terrisporobacter othiniensis]